MKLRIKGNSIRLRLSKSEVEKLSEEGIVKEQTNFANVSFTYSIKKETNGNDIKVDFKKNELSILISEHLIKEWPENDIISFDNRLADGSFPKLYVLVEKDFKCIDNPTEDQGDNYENPKTC